MRKKNLLIDEYPLLVLPSLAKSIGLNEAIALQQLHYWLENPKGGVEIDGHRWVYNTYEDWKKDNFPFWSERTIQRVFTRLESLGLVVSMQKNTYDRKKYYRVHYDKLASWNETECHNPDLQNGMKDDDKEASSLTETTTETTQRIKEIKNSCLEILQDLGRSVFGNDMTAWWNFRRRLEQDNVIITGDEKLMTIAGLSQEVGQFTEAQVYQDRYAPYFAKFGLLISFTE
jgi:hypothetical protein